jgi:isoleucyl-tRNA synthetase
VCGGPKHRTDPGTDSRRNRLIQDLRKRRQCNYTDRIRVSILTTSPQLTEALNANRELIQGETLATELTVSVVPQESAEINGGDFEPVELAEEPIAVNLKVVSGS